MRLRSHEWKQMCHGLSICRVAQQGTLTPRPTPRTPQLNTNKQQQPNRGGAREASPLHTQNRLVAGARDGVTSSHSGDLFQLLSCSVVMDAKEKGRHLCSLRGQMSAWLVLSCSRDATVTPATPQIPRSVHTGWPHHSSTADGFGWRALSVSEPHVGPRLMQNTHPRALPRRDCGL